MKEYGAKYWIEKLQLEPHPEGGYFRQTYKSELLIHPPGSRETRAASTAIYFLLERDNFSAFHRLRSDEMWHFYAGSPLAVHLIDPRGAYSSIQFGSDPEAEQVFQAVVPAGCWFASHLAEHPHQPSTKGTGMLGQPSWGLVGCTVAPGFEFEDFAMGKREDLVKEFPQHRTLIQRLTREK